MFLKRTVQSTHHIRKVEVTLEVNSEKNFGGRIHWLPTQCHSWVGNRPPTLRCGLRVPAPQMRLKKCYGKTTLCSEKHLLFFLYLH